MGATVTVNSPNTVVHKKSGGQSPVFPDVCKTPSPAGPVPVPYPNIAKTSSASQTATTVKADGEKIMLKKSVLQTSTGDEAGSVGGVVSNCTKGKAQFILYSFDVKAEGQNVPRNTDMMKQNGGSSFNAVG
jgi:2',3'-cyclic-nucleotide 2'-phosphodiesterase (5'-nucleotidase family)